MPFAHLHVHSIYSLLDGYSSIKKLVRRAVEMEMPAIGLTDHGTMFGAIDFYNEATKAGIKPIIGVETYMAQRRMTDRDPNYDKKRYHLVLLAQNETGYQNLLQIASASQLDGFYYKPRIDHEYLADHAEGLIATTSCLAGEIPQALMKGDVAGAREKFDYYYDVFGPDNFFVELQDHDIPELPEVNKGLIELNKRYNVQFVATNDVHYVDPDDFRLQDVLLAIQTGSLLADPKRMRMTDASYHLRSPQEMEDLFGHIPGAISNTLAIAERCELDLGFKGYRLPDFPVPEGQTPETELRRLCEEGLRERYGGAADSEALRARLEYELGVIHEMGFDAYFLIVWDLCNVAAKRGIWYTARGSAAGSIVAYCLKITTVDPIENHLIFERFLNPGRVSMPDIDLDFPDDRRAEMMAYCAEKYGQDRVAQIITFGTLKARAAVRDVGRVMDIPLDEVDKVAKMIPAVPGKPVTIEEAIDEVPDLKSVYTSDDRLHELLDTAKHMEGVVRSAGTHAAGVVITDKPIIEYAPLHRPTSSANTDLPIKTVTQFEMNIVDKMGLLKVDFLGLTTLTVMARACELIKERHGIEFTLDNIPVDDPESFEWMGRGDTAGMFQVEGSGMTRFIMQMQPKNLENVIAMIALFRPGPMDFIPAYIKRMHGEEEVSYLHPALEPIFEETFGIAVYQEQIMRAAVEIAGYTNSEADDLRKAIAKKIQEKLVKHRKKFVGGAEKLGTMPAETADHIFENWLEFARYGFNKSHAAVYGVIAVQTAYLKAHYPIEYMTATLSAYKSQTERVALYVADCRRMGIDVLPPDINTSGWDFTIEDREDGSSCIRFGMGAVKNVGHGPAEQIMQEVAAEGPFESVTELARRLDLRHVGKRALDSLIKVGALDGLGSRAALLEVQDRILSISASHFRAADAGQMSLFGEETGLVTEIRLPDLPDDHIDRRDILNWERELIGQYVSDHPLSPYMEELRRVTSHLSSELKTTMNQAHVRVAGLVTRLRRHITRSGKPMAFVTIEDVQGPIELLVFPRTWKKQQDLLEPERVILVEGKLDNEGSDPKVLVNSISTEWTVTESTEPHEPRPPLRREDAVPPAAGEVVPPPADEAQPLSGMESDPRAGMGAEPVSGSGDDGDFDGSGDGPAQKKDPDGGREKEAMKETRKQPNAGETSWNGGGPPPPEDPPDWHMYDMFPVDYDDGDEPIVPEGEVPRDVSPVAAVEGDGETGAAPSVLSTETVADPALVSGEKTGGSRADEAQANGNGGERAGVEGSDKEVPSGERSADIAADSGAGQPVSEDAALESAEPTSASGEGEAGSTVEETVSEPGAGRPVSEDAAQERADPVLASGEGEPGQGAEREADQPASEPRRGAAPAASAGAGPAASGEVRRQAEMRPPLILPPANPSETVEGRPAQMLTITLKANGDRIRDALKIQRIFGMLITHPGNDHFAFYVFEGKKSYLVEFPNYNTRIHDELLAALREISGIESVGVEPIIYQ